MASGALALKNEFGQHSNKRTDLSDDCWNDWVNV
jgi:hypothetical protein